MFSTLTEEDLQVLGITAFGPRKKLLMAINFLATHHNSHGHLSPQIYHHHPPHSQYLFMQQAAAMGGRLPHETQMGRRDLKNPPGIPTQQNQQQQQQETTNGNGGTNGEGGGGQAQVQVQRPGNQEQPQNKTSPGSTASGGGQEGVNATGAAVGNVPPKFSGSAAPGAERRTSNSS